MGSVGIGLLRHSRLSPQVPERSAGAWGAAKAPARRPGPDGRRRSAFFRVPNCEQGKRRGLKRWISNLLPGISIVSRVGWFRVR